MALTALVDSFCNNQKKCGTERVKRDITEAVQVFHDWQSHCGAWYSQLEQVQSSVLIEQEPIKIYTHILMTWPHDHDLYILNMYLYTKVKFPGQDFQNLRLTHRETDATKHITMKHLQVVNIDPVYESRIFYSNTRTINYRFRNVYPILQ